MDTEFRLSVSVIVDQLMRLNLHIDHFHASTGFSWSHGRIMN